MSHEALEGNSEAQQRALSAVAARPAMTRLLSSVAAYSLGAIPLSRDEDGISLATYPGICRGALALLARHLGAVVKPVEFDENVMTFFIDKIYLEGGGVNIHTFRSADFLDVLANDDKVLSAKVEHPEAGASSLAQEEIVLADIHLASHLHNLDTGAPPQIDSWRLGEFCPGFRKIGNHWTVWSTEPLLDDAPLFLQYSENYDGDEFFRDLTAEAVREFPFILFPSEVQILGVDASGALNIYLDGETHSLPAGRPSDLSTEYWLVRHGHRFHRKLEIQVRGIWKVKRVDLDVAPPFRGAGAEELRKWLSL